MAAVVPGQFGDERGSPGGGKAATRRQRSQTTEGRVDKDRLAVRADHHLVGVDLADRVAGGRHIEAITALMEMAWGEEVVEAPDLAAGRHPEAVAIDEQTHGPIEEALVQLELVRLGRAEEQEAVSAVGGEGKRDAQPLKPSCQSRRGGDLQGKGCSQGSQTPRPGECSICPKMAGLAIRTKVDINPS